MRPFHCFIFLALSCASEVGYASAIFYIISYAIMTIGGFGVVLLLQYKTGRGAEISDYSGLNQRHPWVAFMMLLLLLSFAGIPPLLGFDAKLFVMDLFKALLVSPSATVGSEASFFDILSASSIKESSL